MTTIVSFLFISSSSSSFSLLTFLLHFPPSLSSFTFSFLHATFNFPPIHSRVGQGNTKDQQVSRVAKLAVLDYINLPMLKLDVQLAVEDSIQTRIYRVHAHLVLVDNTRTTTNRPGANLAVQDNVSKQQFSLSHIFGGSFHINILFLLAFLIPDQNFILRSLSSSFLLAFSCFLLPSSFSTSPFSLLRHGSRRSEWVQRMWCRPLQELRK